MVASGAVSQEGNAGGVMAARGGVVGGGGLLVVWKKNFPIVQETLSNGGDSPARACEAKVLPMVRRVHEGGMGDGENREMGDEQRRGSGFHNCNGSLTASHPRNGDGDKLKSSKATKTMNGKYSLKKMVSLDGSRDGAKDDEVMAMSGRMGR
ncbi:hypothetical protein TIFTF001_025625 [Ficus carica]|uniref:Uncharacterized protein n=1 Tax=Ficus carica TaxID=3494 RepID=A0AA88AR98_FICCA|nr:hypothetical protein TIFTF001_025625 [Ficus carica]